MLGADVAEANGGLGPFTSTFDIDDHTLTKGWMLNIVADAQSKLL